MATPLLQARALVGRPVTVLLVDGSAVTGRLAGVDGHLNVLLHGDVVERAAAAPGSAVLGTAKARAVRGDVILAIGADAAAAAPAA